MAKILWLDFETQSACDIDRGNYHYSRHPSTRVLFMAFAFDDGDVEVWYPESVFPFPETVNTHIQAGGEVWAHNAVFERLIVWNCASRLYGMAKPAISQMVCTMAMCANMALPLSLENAAIALCLEERKDTDKRKDMLKISKPVHVDPITGEPTFATWETHPKEFQRTLEYCGGDVVVTRAIAKQLKRLSPFEQKVYIMDQEINDRGVKVDIPIVKTMNRLATIERDRLNDDLWPICGLRYTQVAKLKDWIGSFGLPVPALDKYELGVLLKRTDLPAQVRRVLEIRQEAAKSSVDKLDAMLLHCEDDQRARGLIQFGGAVSTLRWAHRAIQPGNLPRPELSAELIETVLDWLSTRRPEQDEDTLDVIRTLYGKPSSIFSDCLRGLLIPEEGKVLTGPDLVAIEPLCSAWLVGDDAKVKFMAESGGVYEEIARLIFGLAPFRGWNPDEGVPVTKAQRQSGKVAELALGYEGGYKEDGAIGTFCAQFRIDYPGEETAKRWQALWRSVHPHHVAYWKAISQAAVDAVLNPGSKPAVGPEGRRVTFRMEGRFLLCRLPSDSVLCYPFPRVEQPKKHFPPSVTYMKSKNKQWFRNSYYGGHGLENVTQRVARDLLAYGMLSLEAAGLPVVFHVHDEAVVEATPRLGLQEEAMRVFTQRPAWAATLPYTSSAFTAKRYRK